MAALIDALYVGAHLGAGPPLVAVAIDLVTILRIFFTFDRVFVEDARVGCRDEARVLVSERSSFRIDLRLSTRGNVTVASFNNLRVYHYFTIIVMLSGQLFHVHLVLGARVHEVIRLEES
jgi:hypothetical protein